VRLVLSRLPEGGVFLDVGAYFGWYSLVVARERRNTRVLAFEPVPASWARLEENRRRNGLENVRAVRAALGAEEMELPPAANGGSAHLARPELERGYVNLFCRARGRAAA
jgi:FkbM family methyltransferase